MSSLYVVATQVIGPFATQRNTGNCYEFYVALQILRKMGLSDEDLASLKPLVDEVVAKNGRSSAKFVYAYEEILKTPVGHGILMQNGTSVVGVRNITQDDGDGGTGDLMLILSDGTEKSISICCGKKKRNGSIEKCLSNPTCQRFGCDAEDVKRFKKISEDAVTAYKAEMTAKHGENEAAWPSRVKTTAANSATAEVAAITTQKFNQFSLEERTKVMKDLLQVSMGKPADFLCVVNEKCSAHLLFEINGVAAGLDWTPTLNADGCFLKMFLGNAEIGSTQVKFNNGVYHKGKPSSLTSSWNATVVMNKVFDVVEKKLF